MKTLSKSSRFIMILVGICIAASIYFPIWRIELDAPQYPEGLALKIYANKLAGDVDVINGLNHYIGMKTLHSEDFWEFTYLPYILGFFALISWFIALINRKSLVKFHLIGFLVFGIFAMYDFWKWEYAYGHDLDPTAAIQIPGMAYQPPLIGFKQLLNFGAYSIPDLGGWFMIGGGLLLAFVFFKESGLIPILHKKNRHLIFIPFFFYLFQGCTPSGPEAIELHKDMCAFCKMRISDGHFGSELITEKGRIYKFDDLYCMREYIKENPDSKMGGLFVHHYPIENQLVSVESVFLVKSPAFRSPMGGNTAAFIDVQEAEKQAFDKKGKLISWEEFLNQ